MRSFIIVHLAHFVFYKFCAIKFGSISISDLESLGLSISMRQGGLEQKSKMNVRIRAFLYTLREFALIRVCQFAIFGTPKNSLVQRSVRRQSGDQLV